MRPPIQIVRLLALACAAGPALFPFRCGAQDASFPDEGALHVPRLSGPITLDGRVREAAWEAVPPLPVVMHVPAFGAPPTERTEFRLAYDGRYLYFSCRNYDSDPGGIQNSTLRRDGSGLNSDLCVLQLDTFNDEETALAFGTTPAGVRNDVAWPNDGRSPGNFSWNTFWDAAVSRDADGWYAELRIPLSSLRFQDEDGDGRVVMGVSAFRVVARKNEFVVFPAIDNRWGRSSLSKASQFMDAEFVGITPARPVYVTPYTLGVSDRFSRWDSAGSAWLLDRRRTFDLGGDLKYALASNLALDLTVNTDFAQVEADDEQVNLTRFRLFYPEKRLFFQERGEVFEFLLGGRDRLFHSRTVGLNSGRVVPILAGARVVGRVGEWDVGLLDMQTDETPWGQPLENLGVLRLRRRVVNENSYVGGIVTSRFAEAGRGHNVLYGLDGILRLFGEDYLALQWAQAFHERDPLLPPLLEAPSDTTGLDRSLARVVWERRGLYGVTYNAEAARLGFAFLPGLGFLSRAAGYTRVGGSVGYGWRAGRASSLLRSGARLDGSVVTRNDDGRVESVALSPVAEVHLKSGHALTAELIGSYEDLPRPFPLSREVRVPAGLYRSVVGRLTFGPPSGSLLRTQASVEAGGFWGGRTAALSVHPSWFPSPHLELGGTFEVRHIVFPDRDVELTPRIARLRTRVMLDARLSAAAFVQFNSDEDRVAANVRLRYNPSEGHDLWLVWNEQLRSDRTGLQPGAPLSESRALMLKYSRTLTLGG